MGKRKQLGCIVKGMESVMTKIIFELMDYKETPNGKEKLSIEFRMEPVRQNGKAKELADRILQTIEDFQLSQNGEYVIREVKKY